MNKIWVLKGCKRCSGDMIIDKDSEGYYESCILCGYIKYFPTQQYTSGQKIERKDKEVKP